MGLDAIEIILTVEDVFSLGLADSEVAVVSTVGQLYELICTKLDLAPSLVRPRGTGRARPIRRLRVAPEREPWNHEDVWATLAAIFVEQMLLEPEEIKYEARIGPDLGID